MLKTPHQWAMVHCFKRGPRPRREKRPAWQHACADVVHGWSQHEHDANGPLELTEEAYLGAIAAIESQAGELKPHEPALSPHCKLHKKPARRSIRRKKKTTAKKDDS
jgi:hypothetical protein